MTTNGASPQEKPGQFLGLVTGGSLSQGVEVRLDAGVSVEDMKDGTHVTIQGEKERFIGIVTDVALGMTDPNMKYAPPDVSDPYIAQVVKGSMTYGTLSVLPMLTLPAALGADDAPKPAKTVPSHFSKVFRASERDEELVFGKEGKTHFFIGNPLDMETKVCLNMEEMVKRSCGVFGKSGTGKTFLTRLLLVGILQNDGASSLIFDMHSEYGWMGQDTDRGATVKGLKQLFPAKVAVFSLDEEHSRRRGVSPDFVLQVGYGDIEPEDVELLRQTLSLSDVAASSAWNLQHKLGAKGWLKTFLDIEGGDALAKLAEDLNINFQALRALYNRLSRLKRYAFITDKPLDDSVNRILECLDQGKHVVLEFGQYGNDLTAYILVANLLTRRIHERYARRKQEAEGGRGKPPRPLVIVIEEAHRFLNPAVAPQTIFGTIAREDRKFNVTLMVIDQRPSAIDSEVMSQVGTKLTCLLDNERDVEAVLAGTPGSRELRTVLSRLDSKQQALIFGHAVPMPVVVRTRQYGASGEYRDLVQPEWSKGRMAGQGGNGANGAGESAEEELDRKLKGMF